MAAVYYVDFIELCSYFIVSLATLQYIEMEIDPKKIYSYKMFQCKPAEAQKNENNESCT